MKLEPPQLTNNKVHGTDSSCSLHLVSLSEIVGRKQDKSRPIPVCLQFAVLFLHFDDLKDRPVFRIGHTSCFIGPSLLHEIEKECTMIANDNVCVMSLRTIARQETSSCKQIVWLRNPMGGIRGTV